MNKDGNKMYFDNKSKQVVELVECNDKERFLMIRPEGSKVCAKLEFSPGFLASDYLKKHFTEVLK